MMNKEKDLKDELVEVKDQLKALQGSDIWGSLDLKELCLIPTIAIPKKFKVPDFDKYDGSGNPIYHLKAYCTKMSIWSQDEKFLVNFFPESLTGPALTWYMQLDQTKIRRWRDLTDVFMKQYKFNLDTAPTREQLKAMSKKATESFKEYAQRWRVVAAQVQPPMMNSELCSYFIRTLPNPFYQHMVGTHVADFADLMSIGERIDTDIRDGKISMSQAESNSRRGQDLKKKEGNVNYIQSIRQTPTGPPVFHQMSGRNQRQAQFGPVPDKQGRDG